MNPRLDPLSRRGALAGAPHLLLLVRMIHKPAQNSRLRFQKLLKSLRTKHCVSLALSSSHQFPALPPWPWPCHLWATVVHAPAPTWTQVGAPGPATPKMGLVQEGGPSPYPASWRSQAELGIFSDKHSAVELSLLSSTI